MKDEATEVRKLDVDILRDLRGSPFTMTSTSRSLIRNGEDFTVTSCQLKLNFFYVHSNRILFKIFKYQPTNGI